MNPALAEEINHEMEEGVSEKRNVEKTLSYERLKKFHDAILDGYCVSLYFYFYTKKALPTPTF